MKNIEIVNIETVPIIYWHDIPDEVKKDEFDWYTDEDDDSFFLYRGEYYCLNDFTVPPKELKYNGIKTETFFSGILIKFKENDSENLIVASYYMRDTV